jgi:tRNA (guanine-N7-)-methyltransferase
MTERPVTDGATFWRMLFGSDAPVEIEIGSGDGVFLTAYAARAPDRHLFGIERSPAKARRLADRVARLGGSNVRTLQAVARCVVESIVPAASVTAYHVYFPDPWPKRGHAPRRIFTPAFVAGLARTLMPGGRLFFATDVAGYARVASGHVLAAPAFREAAVAGDQHPGLTTSFARKYRAGGRALHAYAFERGAAVGDDQLLAASKIRSR